jgi:hypothetical protein
VKPTPAAEAWHCSRLEKPHPRIPEVLVPQNSPACAAGDAITTKANVNSAAADAAMVLEIDFIFLSFRQIVGMLFWRFVDSNGPKRKAQSAIRKMHSLHPNMLNLNDGLQRRSPGWSGSAPTGRANRRPMTGFAQSGFL